MGVNLDKPYLWESDIMQSMKLYNAWFMDFAPEAFKEARKSATEAVKEALKQTDYLTDISVDVLQQHPEILQVLRMCLCPPLARDRLAGLAGVGKSLLKKMEDPDEPRIPSKMSEEKLQSVLNILTTMADRNVFPWLEIGERPEKKERKLCAAIVAERLCGTVADTIIRDEQERRQLSAIADVLERKGYSFSKGGVRYDKMKPGSFSFHTNIPVYISGTRGETVNIPVDVAIMPQSAGRDSMPLLLEAKSAGDFTNVNKRRKEEAVKMQQLRNTYGKGISYFLFLCGYFDSRYLGYEAAEGIDWIWEHRITDMDKLEI